MSQQTDASLNEFGRFAFQKASLGAGTTFGVHGQRYIMRFMTEVTQLSLDSHEIEVGSCAFVGVYGKTDLNSFAVYGRANCSTSCPPNAVCNGSTAFEVTPGHWRHWLNSTFLYPCEITEACGGGYYSEVPLAPPPPPSRFASFPCPMLSPLLLLPSLSFPSPLLQSRDGSHFRATQGVGVGQGCIRRGGGAPPPPPL